MRKIEIDAPGGEESPYATEAHVREFFGGISDDRLDELLRSFPWVKTRQLGKDKQYNALHVAMVNVLLDLVGEHEAQEDAEPVSGKKK